MDNHIHLFWMGWIWQTVANCLLPYTANSQRPKIRHQTAVLWSLVSALVLSRLDYGSATLAGLPTYLLNRLQSVLNAAAWLVHSARKHDHVTPLLRELHWLRMRQRIDYKHAVLIFHCLYTVRRHHTSPRDFSAWQKLMHEGISDRRRRTRLWYHPRVALDHRWSRLLSGRFASLELASDDCHVAAVTAKRQLKTVLFARCYTVKCHTLLRRDPVFWFC